PAHGPVPESSRIVTRYSERAGPLQTSAERASRRPSAIRLPDLPSTRHDREGLAATRLPENSRARFRRLLRPRRVALPGRRSLADRRCGGGSWKLRRARARLGGGLRGLAIWWWRPDLRGRRLRRRHLRGCRAWCAGLLRLRGGDWRRG